MSVCSLFSARCQHFTRPKGGLSGLLLLSSFASSLWIFKWDELAVHVRTYRYAQRQQEESLQPLLKSIGGCSGVAAAAAAAAVLHYVFMGSLNLNNGGDFLCTYLHTILPPSLPSSSSSSLRSMDGASRDCAFYFTHRRHHQLKDDYGNDDDDDDDDTSSKQRQKKAEGEEESFLKRGGERENDSMMVEMFVASWSLTCCAVRAQRASECAVLKKSNWRRREMK